MLEPVLHKINCIDAFGHHMMAYWQWGPDEATHLILCVHGLTRQGRDFDVLARSICMNLGNEVKVVCPDVVGRGKSDWLKDARRYQLPTYLDDITDLIKHLSPNKLDWVGTSMGGLIGMIFSSETSLINEEKRPNFFTVRRLVLNDVGPSLEWSALERIGKYVGKTPSFDSIQEGIDALWKMQSSFGTHSQEEWFSLSEPMLRKNGDLFLMHYDPAIGEAFRSLTKQTALESEAFLWSMYDHIKAETLILRGVESDLLSFSTAHLMTRRGPRAKLIEFEKVGHAPTLISNDQVQSVLSFLAK